MLMNFCIENTKKDNNPLPLFVNIHILSLRGAMRRSNLSFDFMNFTNFTNLQLDELDELYELYKLISVGFRHKNRQIHSISREYR